MKLNLTGNKTTADSISNQSLISLYDRSFWFILPPLMTIAILELIFFTDGLITFLLLDVVAALFFFKFFGKKTIIQEHQICFHQVFVVAAAIASITWFVIDPSMRNIVVMLMTGSISGYLLIELRATISYIVLFYTFLIYAYFTKPGLSIEFLLFSIAFSAGSILVSSWLNQLISTGNSLEKSKTKYKALFEGGNFAILLLIRNGDEFLVEESNSQCSNLFNSTEKSLKNKTFNSFLNKSEDRKELNEKLKTLTHFDRITAECELIRPSDNSIFIAEISFLGLEMDDKFIIQVHFNDITDKVDSTKKMHQNAEGFRSILDNSLAAMFIFSNNKLVYQNSNGEILRSEILNDESEDLHEIFPKKHHDLLEELVNESKNKISSYTQIELDGGKKRYSIHFVNIVYRGEKANLIMLMDIGLQNEYNIQRLRAEIAEETNRKLSDEIKKHELTQKELTKNTSKLNALFESSSNLFILTIDRDLNIASFNSSFKRMMKEYLSVDVEIGDDFLNTFPIAEAAYGKLIKRFKRALRGESVEIISHFPTLKGQTWIESFISPVRVEGEPIKEIVFIAHNITDKVLNQRRVKDSEANNRATVSAIPDMLFKVNKEGYFTDFRLNEEGGRLLKNFAFTTDLLDMHVNDVFKNKELAKAFLIHIKKALQTGRVHTQNFIIPFLVGRTKKKMYYENRYSRVNSNEVIVITRDVTDKVEFETRLIESVQEKEILLKEVHHRVKNNLQVISSILNLQSSYVEDEKTLEIINESQNRIRSMSYIHESLYQTKDFSSIDFHDYITNLIQNLVHSYQIYTSETKLNLKVDRVQLVLDQAIPCGLILNELVSNSMKYAYPEGKEGEIQVEIKEEGGKVKIRVEDFGVGLPEGFKIEDSDSLGLGLVDTLVDQIDGELILNTEKGTKYLIIFDKQES